MVGAARMASRTDKRMASVPTRARQTAPKCCQTQPAPMQKEGDVHTRSASGDAARTLDLAAGCADEFPRIASGVKA